MKQKKTKYTQINANKSTQSEMGPMRRNPIQRTEELLMCAYDCAHLQYTIQHKTVISSV